MNLDASLIIVNWKVRDYLKRCLESVYRYAKGIDFEVFVVDNDSRDGSPDMVRESFPQVNMIANNKNLGFARANNLALARCKGRYILFLNPDTELVDNSIKSMVEFMDSHPDISALGPKLIYPDGSLQRSCRHFPSLFTDLMESLYLDELFPNNKFINYYRMGSWSHDVMRQVDQPAGACLLIRYEVFEKIGIMDERFFIFFEEVDVCCRIKKHGGNIYFNPDIRVIHAANKSTGQSPVETRRNYIRSKLLFFEKYYGTPSIALELLILTLRSILDIMILPAAYFVTGHPEEFTMRVAKNKLRILWEEYMRFILCWTRR